MKLDPRRIIRHDHSDNNNGGRLAANASGSVAGGGTTTVAATRLRDLTDVDLVTTAPADNDALTYDLATATWVPGSGAYELTTEGGQSVIYAHGSMGSTETFDPTDGNVHTGTLNADCTFTLNAPTGSGACILEFEITEDSTGGWAITWPGTVTEVGTHDTTADTTQLAIVKSNDGGASWLVVWIGGSTVGALDDLSDVVITSPTAADRLRYNGSAWVNSPALWVPAMVEDGATGLWYVAVTGDGDAVMTEVS